MPSAQHTEPHACDEAQQAPPWQTWPRAQHFLPHCCATLQQAPKKQVWMLLQHWPALRARGGAAGGRGRVRRGQSARAAKAGRDKVPGAEC